MSSRQPSRCLLSRLQGIMKTNLALLKLFLERWRSAVTVRRRLVYRLLTFCAPTGTTADPSRDEHLERTARMAGLQARVPTGGRRGKTDKGTVRRQSGTRTKDSTSQRRQ